MNMESNEFKKRELRDFGLKSLWKVTMNSWHGLVYFYKYERSAILHLVAAILMLLGAWMLEMSPMEWLVIIMVLFTTLSVELLNTAIEKVCDLVTKDYNMNIKVAKDAGSAATGVLTLVRIVVVLIIYVPKIIEFVESLL